MGNISMPCHVCPHSSPQLSGQNPTRELPVKTPLPQLGFFPRNRTALSFVPARHPAWSDVTDSGKTKYFPVLPSGYFTRAKVFDEVSL